MKYSLEQLFNIDELTKLCKSFTKLNGVVTAILDLDGNIHVATGWQPICTQFHRCNIESKKRCTESDTILAGQLKQGESYNIYKCKNGLVDVAVPIIIEDVHVGNFFTGQFLSEKPDIEYFRKQAQIFGFDEKKYLDALKKTPIFSEKKIKNTIQFLVQLTETIGNIGFQKLREIENRKQIETDKENIKKANNELIETKRKAEESEEKVRNIFENSSIVHYSHDLNHVVNYVSPQIENMLGYTPEEIMVKWTSLVSDSPKNEEAFKITTKAIETGEKQKSYELEFLHKNGKRVLVEVHEAPLVKEGKTIALVGSFSDITERKEAEKEILKAKNKAEESEKKFRKSIEHAPYPIMIHAEGEVIQLSDAWTKITGYKLKDIPSIVQWTAKAYGEDAILSKEFIDKLYEIDSMQYDGEWEITIKNGDKRIWDFRTSPIGRLSDGRRAVTTMAVDITDRKSVV